jgi:HD-like signal output (HDOD) protein
VSAAAPQTAADFVQVLARDLTNRELELPTFPDSVIRIQRAFQAENVNTGEIVRIISSDPALAARVIQIANSAAVRTSANEIVDVRKAVVQMGFKLVQSSAVAFALRQLERNESLSPNDRAALRSIWNDSVELASICFVIAKKYTKLNADEALLTGLLSVLGRLYIFMKAQDYADLGFEALAAILDDWHPAIAKAIAETWGMSDELAKAVESQLENDPPVEELPTLTEVLIAARLLAQHEKAGEPLDAGLYPVLQRLGVAGAGEKDVKLTEHAEQISNIRSALMK